jgi:hypothetical protein
MHDLADRGERVAACESEHESVMTGMRASGVWQMEHGRVLDVEPPEVSDAA